MRLKTGSNVGVRQMEGFDASLQLLVEVEQYSLTDVGLMFNVSRERIRQLCATRGLNKTNGHAVGLFCVRVWNDELNRFQPIRKKILLTAKRRIRMQERANAKHIRATDLRNRMVAMLKQLAEELGYTPTLTEFACRWYGKIIPVQSAGGLLCGLWWSGRISTYAAITTELYEQAGLTKRSNGGPGHLPKTVVLTPTRGT